MLNDDQLMLSAYFILEQNIVVVYKYPVILVVILLDNIQNRIIKSIYLSLKCAKLRYKKSLYWCQSKNADISSGAKKEVGLKPDGNDWLQGLQIDTLYMRPICNCLPRNE